jgi:hypothetical protein
MDPRPTMRSTEWKTVAHYSVFRILFVALFLVALVWTGCLKNGGNSPILGSKGKKSRQTLHIEESWSGEMPMGTRRKLGEEPFAISDQDEWQKTWKQIRGYETLPVIDFNELVVVVIISCDRSKFELTFFRDFDGELLYTPASSPDEQINTKVCAYVVTAVKREGLRSFNGKLLGPPRHK